jgi:hypothetical protein
LERNHDGCGEPEVRRSNFNICSDASRRKADPSTSLRFGRDDTFDAAIIDSGDLSQPVRKSETTGQEI